MIWGGKLSIAGRNTASLFGTRFTVFGRRLQRKSEPHHQRNEFLAPVAIVCELTDEERCIGVAGSRSSILRGKSSSDGTIRLG